MRAVECRSSNYFKDIFISEVLFHVISMVKSLLTIQSLKVLGYLPSHTLQAPGVQSGMVVFLSRRNLTQELPFPLDEH